MSTLNVRELVLQNQGLVRFIANSVARSTPKRMDMEDLIAYGQVGLAEAASEFDPTLGHSFSTYAYYRVKGAILDGIYQMSWYSRAYMRQFQLSQMTKEALEDQRENEGTDSKPDQSLRKSVARLMVIGLTLDAANEQGGGDFVDPNAPTPGDMLDQEETNYLVRKAISQLTDLEKEVIESRYFRNEKLSAIAERHGKDKSWASRLHGKALENLAEALAALQVEASR